jgi:hypothetical protein
MLLAPGGSKWWHSKAHAGIPERYVIEFPIAVAITSSHPTPSGTPVSRFSTPFVADE